MNYVYISDSHHHQWQAFSTTGADGVNSRNKIIIDETWRAAQHAKKIGATLVHAGDLFHVRGNIAPSVLNPVLELYKNIIASGVPVVMIPGNHDMEARDSQEMCNAVTALSKVGVQVINTSRIYGDELVLVPWFSTVDALKFHLDDMKSLLAGYDIAQMDLVIHAPIDGVIKGLPDHGLDPAWLAGLGFRRVFAGHYHNHKIFPGNVISIGALTHQTWGDVGSLAGFVSVEKDRVSYNASHAPSFVDLDPTLSEEEIEMRVDGNYVRVTVEIEKDSQAGEIRDWLLGLGAAGVVVHPIKKTGSVSRTGATVSSGVSLGASINEFVKLKKYSRPEKLNALCAEILAETEGGE